MEVIGKSLEQARKKHKTVCDDMLKEVDQILTLLDATKRAIAPKPAGVQAMDTTEEGAAASSAVDQSLVRSSLQTLSEEIARKSAKMKQSLDDTQDAVAKFGKAIDKTFQTNISRITPAETFAGKEAALDRVIAQHFFQQGRFAIGEVFAREAGVTVDVAQKDTLYEMFTVLEGMRQHALGPALAFVAKNRRALDRMGSTLEFRLHRLQAVRLLHEGKRAEAATYVQQHLARFSDSRMAELRHLMGAFLHAGERLAKSRYADLLDDANWREAGDTFTHDMCALLGFSHESPLLVAVNAGAHALPKLVKMADIIKATNQPEPVWSNKSELAVDIPLGKDRQYHTVFSCPVSREISTAANPPVRLPCGHVICRESAQKMSKAARIGRRFKCATCPTETTMNEVQEIHF